MRESVSPRLPKWPFILGDLILILFAASVALQTPGRLSILQGLLCLAALATGAWLAVLPYLRQFHAVVRMNEAETLAIAALQLRDLTQIKDQIVNATSQWQNIQQQSDQAVTAAEEMTQRMRAELTEFCAFLKKVNDSEKSHLKLEVEKLRRTQSDWVQVTVHILDHIFSLHRAALRSGQAGLIQQLEQFQHACRDAARRVGLVPFVPAPGDLFDGQLHECPEANGHPETGATVGETIAAGIRYQGQVVRRALIRRADAVLPGNEPSEVATSPVQA